MYSIWKLSKVYLLPLKNVNRIASSPCCVRLESGPPPACRRKVVSASTQDGAAGKALEAQRCWLFVTLERWIDGTLELAQEIETTEFCELPIRPTCAGGWRSAFSCGAL